MTPRTGRWVFAAMCSIQLLAAWACVDSGRSVEAMLWSFVAGLSFTVSVLAFVLTADGEGDIR